MRIPARQLLHAAYGRHALGAFNVCNLEQVHGLFRGASQARAPIIVQFTRVMRDYAHPLMLEQLLRGAERIYPDVVFAAHHDHGDEASCGDAIASGHYSSVMIDASHLPFEENVAVTKRIVDQAHGCEVAVEAELGQLKGVEDDASEAAHEAILTEPAKAAEFVERTGCDSLAVAIGTSHGAYKFPGMQRLQLDVLAEIQRRLPGFPLVLHGGSAVSPKDVERINAAGGRLDSAASGVPVSDLERAIQLGITKVNIATDGRLLWTRVHREFFRDRPGEFDFMVPGRTYMNEFADLVAAKCEQLGAAGKATDAVIPLGREAALPSNRQASSPAAVRA